MKKEKKRSVVLVSMSTHTMHKQQICWPLWEVESAMSAFWWLNFPPPPPTLQQSTPLLHSVPSLNNFNIQKCTTLHGMVKVLNWTQRPWKKEQLREAYRAARNSHVDHDFHGAVEVVVGVGAFLAFLEPRLGDNLNSSIVESKKGRK